MMIRWSKMDIMELDSEDMTPPSSPLLGLGCDEQSLIKSGVVYCLNCKGATRTNDHCFSAAGYILRREIITAIDNLRHGFVSQSSDKPELHKCFGHLFDPLDQKQVKNMIRICRKNISALEVLSNASHSFNPLQNYDVSPSSEDPDDICNQNPWILRMNVCHFLNIIVRGLKYYRSEWKMQDFRRMFDGLKKSLMPVNEWSSVLKTHCGFRSGNECTSPIYHFFHLQLELKWSLFLIYGTTETSVSWLLDDMIQLAKFKYGADDTLSLDERQPFNCYCVKEIWTMIKLLVDDLKPEDKRFWDYYTEAIKRVPGGADHFFPLWLTSKITQISDYDVVGSHRTGLGRNDSLNDKNNAYPYIHSLYKDWMSRGGKSAEVLKLTFNFFQFWGGDCDVLNFLWAQWVPRVDKGNDVSNFQSYSSIVNWVKLISEICESSSELCGNTDKNNENISHHQYRSFGSNKDPFLEFVCLVAGYARHCSERDIRKFKSNFCMKLSRSSTNEFAEIGIYRVCSMFMALSHVLKFEREAVSISDRLQDIFTYGKLKNTPGRRKAVLRAYSCMIIVLLQRKISLLNNSSLTAYMKILDELLCQNNSDQTRKDLVMVYLDLLDTLPKLTPNLDNMNLGRAFLISSNLSMWLSYAGHNYVLRTVQCLSGITEWVVSWAMNPDVFQSVEDSEGKALFVKISEKTLSFMRSKVVLNANRIPSTDVKPLACLAADIILLTKKLGGSRGQIECETNFDLFVLNERSCPYVSQYFVQRLFEKAEFIENSFSVLKWTQTWIRLVALDLNCCLPPDGLTKIVLGRNYGNATNPDLLTAFCEKVDDKMSRNEIQKSLSPLATLLIGVMSGGLFKVDNDLDHDTINIINSVITCCTIVLKNKFESVYIKGMSSSLGHQILEKMAPTTLPGLPPWEKLSPEIMRALKKNLFDIYESFVVHATTSQDLFLTRKLQDIVVFAVFGFTSSENVDESTHPAVRIMEHSEQNEITHVRKTIIPNAILGDHVVTDLKLASLLISTVQIFRMCGKSSQVMRFLVGVLRIFIRHCDSVGKTDKRINNCINTVIYCCLVASCSAPHFKQLVKDSFREAFQAEFQLRSRQVFNLFNPLVKSNRNVSNGNLDARRFLKWEIVPLLKEFVHLTETRRGIGIDRSLRESLKKIEDALKDVPDVPSG